MLLTMKKGNKLMTMKLRPHHVLDIISSHGHGEEFKPHPYGHAVHTVAQAIIADLNFDVEFIAGADEICRPCRHLQASGQCDDVSNHLGVLESKQAYNDALDRKLFGYLGFKEGAIITMRQYLEKVNAKVPGIEQICSHPGEDKARRLEGLKKGLKKLGVRK